MFDRCPWATAVTDPLIGRCLTAHGIASREWSHRFPMPGRPDPRLLEAFVVITNEHDRIDRARLDEAAKQDKRR